MKLTAGLEKWIASHKKMIKPMDPMSPKDMAISKRIMKATKGGKK